MESEVDLNDTVQELHVIATNPDMYHHLVELNAIKSLLQLVTHENTDISIGVIDLLHELTDVDTLNESEDSAGALVDALVREIFICCLTSLFSLVKLYMYISCLSIPRHALLRYRHVVWTKRLQFRFCSTAYHTPA